MKNWFKNISGWFSSRGVQSRGLDGGNTNRTNPAPRIRGDYPDPRNVREVIGTRERAWALYDNNSIAKNIVNTIVSRVVGTGMTPQPLATNEDGSPNFQFRTDVMNLWNQILPMLDVSGPVSQGGVDFHSIVRTAFQDTIISGEILLQKHIVSRSVQQQYDLPVPLLCVMFDCSQMEDQVHFSRFESRTTSQGNNIFRGVERNQLGRVSHYHLYDRQGITGLGEYSLKTKTKRVRANRFSHPFIRLRNNQSRGISMFAPVLMDMRDLGDYRFNELQASLANACIMLNISQENAGGKGPSLNGSAGGSGQITDSDGNPVDRLQPMMITRTTGGSKLESFFPNRPNNAIVEFSQFIEMGISGGILGLKPSDVTNDHRRSSFSSERAADNKAWPGIEIFQQFVGREFYQPFYAEAIDLAVMNGLLKVDRNDYMLNRWRYLDCMWSGPVCRSINPTDDELARKLQIMNGTKSIQQVISESGSNWRRVLDQTNEYLNYCVEIKLIGEEEASRIKLAFVNGQFSDHPELIKNLVDLQKQMQANQPHQQGGDDSDRQSESDDSQVDPSGINRIFQGVR